VNDVFVRLQKLPRHVLGYVIEDENGDCNMYINDSLTTEEQHKVYNHEMAHIQNEHFRDSRGIREIEREASM